MREVLRARSSSCTYVDRPPPGAKNPTGHGFDGWLQVSKVDPMMAVGDKQILETVRMRPCSRS